MYLDYIVPKTDIQSRIQSLQMLMAKKELDAVWISQTADLFYFTGTAQSAHLIMLRGQQPVLFVKKYLPRAIDESGISDVRPMKNIASIGQMLNSIKISALGLELDVIPANQFIKCREFCPEAKIVDISLDIRQIRMIKSEWEIDMVRLAAHLLDLVFEKIPSWLVEGMTEIALAAQIEGFLRSQGHQGYLPMRAFNGALYYGNIAFGESAAVRGSFEGPTNGPGLYPAVPAGPGTKRLERGQPIFIDLVSGVGGYLADATRVFCLDRLPDPLHEAHKICIEIQNATVAAILEGTTGSELYQKGIDLAAQRGIAANFMGVPDDKVAFIAHGVGIEIDELPLVAKRYDFPLLQGSILAVEPKVVFPAIGAVGIENTFLVKKDAVEKLLHAPEEVIEVI